MSRRLHAETRHLKLIAKELDITPSQMKLLGCGSGTIRYRFDGEKRSIFLKIAPAHVAHGIIQSECDGLIALSTYVKTPEIIGQGKVDGFCWLGLGWLSLSPKSEIAAARLGTQVAMMHKKTANRYGWEHDNWIGTTTQRNLWESHWSTFFLKNRLEPQLQLVAGKNANRIVKMADRLRVAVAEVLKKHNPKASLLHGDLWGGNWGALTDATPVLFDPAIHYADRECDLAMTELFGGFPDSFYEAYERIWPLSEGYERRRNIYALYHVLNHFNMFGVAYESQCLALIQEINKSA